MEKLMALSVLDGRYSSKVEILREFFSEYGLIKYRLFSELQWLKFLLTDLKLAQIEKEDFLKIDRIFKNFNPKACLRVKEIERTTNHDVKALEYYIKEELAACGLHEIKEWVHFGCTSEDINNTAYALMLKEGVKLLNGYYQELLSQIEDKAVHFKSIPMMSRTHGQPASPTTLGKEFINFAWRIRNELKLLANIPIWAKMNGATGNFNAHHFVFPDIDWIAASKRFISRYLELSPLMITTQINPYSHISQILHALIRLSAIVNDLNKDMWGYISIGYFKQKLKSGEIGSSTMPHKVNPIDFENSEGNLGISIAMMEHMAVKLQNSRFQRDLSDSTVLRNLGSVWGYILIGLLSTNKGLSKLDLNAEKIHKDLDENLELLAEPVQTLMRIWGEDNPYEKLKELTRGVKITQEKFDNFIDGLESVDDESKKRMKDLTPAKYIGLAEQLVDEYFASE